MAKVKSRFDGMTIEELRHVARSEFSLNVDEQLTCEQIIEAIVQMEAAKRELAAKENAKTVKKAKRPTMKVKFVNIESEGADIEFTREFERYHLFHGEEYELPTDVVHHLNALQYPSPVYKQDNFGRLTLVERRMANRFACLPV